MKALSRSLSLPAAVVFDCDGVLVDSEPIHFRAFQKVLEPFGLEFTYDEYVKHYIGFDDRDTFLEAFRRAARPLDAAALADLIDTKSAALQAIVSGGLSTFPGLAPLVEELVENRVPLAVASGSLRHEIHMYLKALGFESYFPTIVAADDVQRSKPDPETYLAVLEFLRKVPGLRELNATRCVAIEDTPAGIQSARAAGLWVVGVAHSFPAKDLETADCVVESLTQLSLARLAELINVRKAELRDQRPE